MKKFIKLLLFLVFLFPCVVLADTAVFDVQNVIDRIMDTYYIKTFEELGEDITLDNDKEGKILTFKIEGEEPKELSVEYDESGFYYEATEEPDLVESFFQIYAFGSIQQAVFEEAGYHNYTIDPEDESLLNLEEYGIVVTRGEVDIEDESGHLHYDYIESFEINLTKNKVQKLYEDFGYYLLPELGPTLEMKSATETTLDIQMSLGDGYDGEFYDCELYISKDEGATYTKYTTAKCNSKVTVTGLEAGKKYYFKGNVVDDTYVSTPVAISTTVAPSNGKENPNTGSNISMFIVPALLLIGLLGVAFSNNKKVFKDL